MSNEQLSALIVELRGRERELVLELLTALGEFDLRRGYDEIGYSSMFSYMTQKLGYLEPTAAKRIGALRCLRENPELAQMYRAGKVTLSSMSLASKAIQEKCIELCAISGKSSREVQLAVSTPQDKKPPERIKPVVVKAPPLLQTEKPEERYQLTFSVTKEVYEDFRKVRDRLARSEGLSLEAIFGRLVKDFLKEPEARRARLSKNFRYIPKQVRREVWKRDGGRCTFCAPDGTQCNETRYLELDHIVPTSCGGESTPSNLRLHCRAHNQLQARRILGEELMKHYQR